ncbi:MAG: restriction endonuclease PLD domain-containing protein, partial [Maribacter dokdonensis]
MLTDNLYDQILLQPSIASNRLFIVSGYASATFLNRHILDLKKFRQDFKICLIIGMPFRYADHIAYLRLIQEYQDNFIGFYYKGSVPVHSKAYAWYDNDKESIAFCGSANYSQYGFFSTKQINQMSRENVNSVKEFYESLLPNSIPITAIETSIEIDEEIPHLSSSIPNGTIYWVDENTVVISFLTKMGILPEKSGLNWGHRFEKKRNKSGDIFYEKRHPAEAYLSLRLDSRKEGFLPEKAYTFSLITDDNESFDCVVAQQGRKAIETTNDNRELGKYIRKR